MISFVSPIARCPALPMSAPTTTRWPSRYRNTSLSTSKGAVACSWSPARSNPSPASSVCARFADAAKPHPGIAIVGVCVGDYRARHRARRRRALAGGRRPLDGCLAANDIMAMGVLDALRAAGRTAPVAGVNAIPEADRGDPPRRACSPPRISTPCAWRISRPNARCATCAASTVPRQHRTAGGDRRPAQLRSSGTCRTNRDPVPTLEETLACKS